MAKKIISILCVLTLLLTVAVGCSAPEQETTTTEQDVAGEETQETQEETTQTEPLRWAIMASQEGDAEYANLIALAAENGIEVETVVLPDPVAGEADKLLISLMGGESFDLILKPIGNMIPFINAGVVSPIQELADNAGYDLDATFGDYVMGFDGVDYGVPAFSDVAITLYNKQIFDDANIPYPTAEDWTWEKFVEVGKQITNEEEGIYGAYNPLWAHYNYMYAMQKGVSHFKEDGTSNYDDPAFKEAIEFYYGLGNTEGVNPPFLIQESRQMPVHHFTTGTVGMSVAGGWTTSWLTDTEKYPRDWQAGMLPMPYPEGEDPSTSVVVSGFYIPTTSTQPELAFECATLFAENFYLMGGGRIPARVDLTDEEINTYIETDLAQALSADGITVEDIKAAWFNTETRPFEEKVIHPAAGDINKIFVEEGGLYGIGEQDIDTTMANIKERADDAIADSEK